MEPSPAQVRAVEFFDGNFDKVLVSPPNLQGNMLIVALEYSRHSEAGKEIMRWLIDPSGFVRWATYTLGNAQMFGVLLNEYFVLVGLPPE